MLLDNNIKTIVTVVELSELGRENAPVREWTAKYALELECSFKIVKGSGERRRNGAEKGHESM